MIVEANKICNRDQDGSIKNDVLMGRRLYFETMTNCSWERKKQIKRR